MSTPDDITAREAKRVLGMLSADDRASVEAYVHMERRAATGRVEWFWTLMGALIFGTIVGICCLMGTKVYADAALRVDAVNRQSQAAHSRARAVEKKCIDQIVCNGGDE